MYIVHMYMPFLEDNHSHLVLYKIYCCVFFTMEDSHINCITTNRSTFVFLKNQIVFLFYFETLMV